MAQIKSKIYLLLIISFLFLLVSLSYSLTNINKNTKTIDNFHFYYLELSSKITDLNYKIKKNQANTLQAILLNEKLPENYNLFVKLIDNIDTFAKKDEKLYLDFAKKIKIIKKRLLAYKSVELSIIEAISSEYPEDLKDALVGYNLVTQSFLTDVNELTNKMKGILEIRISELKESNIITQNMIIVSFFASVLLVLLSIIKLNRLQSTLKSELNRAIEAESKEKSLQLQLLKYNENLESEITKKTNELYQKVYTHFLSGLPNRNKLLEDSSIYDFSQMALLNIDKFQKFNDVFGEELGNLAIIKTAEFIKEFLETEDAYVYHISGDEFAVLVKESTNVDNERFIQEINNFLKLYRKEVFILDNNKQSFLMSAGIAFGSGRKILAYADMALKDAKQKNEAISVFSEVKGLEKIHKQDIECRNKLLHAFDNEEVLSYFQPISPIQDDSLEVKYESLVRIKDGDNIIPPISFIDVAKQNKIYYKITNAVLKNTLKVIAEYQVPCSVNVSIMDIKNKRTLSYIYNLLDEFNYNYLLTVELLETEDFDDYDEVIKFCKKIRSYGIKIALDDFGAGYSNFSHILNLPIDYIKIDASLVSNIDRDTQSQIMVETIVGLAKRLNVKTIAEYVSSSEILETVRKLYLSLTTSFILLYTKPSCV